MNTLPNPQEPTSKWMQEHSQTRAYQAHRKAWKREQLTWKWVNRLLWLAIASMMVVLLPAILGGCVRSSTTGTVDPVTGVFTFTTITQGIGNNALHNAKSMEFLVDKTPTSFQIHGSGSGEISADQNVQDLLAIAVKSAVEGAIAPAVPVP